jgi:hypothetical protein
MCNWEGRITECESAAIQAGLDGTEFQKLRKTVPLLHLGQEEETGMRELEDLKISAWCTTVIWDKSRMGQ